MRFICVVAATTPPFYMCSSPTICMIEIILFLVFLAGATIRFFDARIERVGRWASKFLVYIGLPVLVFNSLHGSPLSGGASELLMLLVAVLLVALSPLLYIFFFSLSSSKRASLYLCGGYGNTAFLGIPIAFVLFGDFGVAVAGVMTFVTVILSFSLGAFIATRIHHGKNALKVFFSSPLVYALGLAIVLGFAGVPTHSWLIFIGDSAIFIALFAVGAFLDVRKLHWRLLVYALPKLILAPILVAALLLLLGRPAWHPAVLIAAMPAAFMMVPLTVELDLNRAFASEVITASTVLFLLIAAISGIFVTL